MVIGDWSLAQRLWKLQNQIWGITESIECIWNREHMSSMSCISPNPTSTAQYYCDSRRVLRESDPTDNDAALRHTYGNCIDKARLMAAKVF